MTFRFRPHKPVPGSTPATGMKTNGVGQFVDWLNHTRSLVDNRGTLADAEKLEAVERRRRSLEAAAEARRAAPRPYAGAPRR